MNAVVDPALFSRESPKRGHLDWLESEAIHILREVAGECANPVLFFSGGKDSIVLLRLAEKAFRPARFPFPLLHIDTGHNYQEVIAFRDARAAELGERLLVRSVEDSIHRGTVRLRNAGDSRNAAQSVTLLEAVTEFGYDACIGGGTPRRREGPCERTRVLVSRRIRSMGPEESTPRVVESLQHAGSPRRAYARLSDQQLDRARCVAIH